MNENINAMFLDLGEPPFVPGKTVQVVFARNNKITLSDLYKRAATLHLAGYRSFELNGDYQLNMFHLLSLVESLSEFGSIRPAIGVNSISIVPLLQGFSCGFKVQIGRPLGYNDDYQRFMGPVLNAASKLPQSYAIISAEVGDDDSNLASTLSVLNDVGIKALVLE